MASCLSVAPEVPLWTCKDLFTPNENGRDNETISKSIKEQRSIPVRCVSPALYRTGGFWQRPPGQRQPGQTSPWTETPPPCEQNDQPGVKTLPQTSGDNKRSIPKEFFVFIFIFARCEWILTRYVPRRLCPTTPPLVYGSLSLVDWLHAHTLHKKDRVQVDSLIYWGSGKTNFKCRRGNLPFASVGVTPHKTGLGRVL